MASTELIITFLQALIFPGIIFLFGLAFFYEWVDRKFYARLQNRYGPLHTGPSGLLQPFADFVKLLAKEDITPKAADRLLFTATPIFLLAIPTAALFCIPMTELTALVSFEGDLIYVIFLSTLISIATFLAAWSSTNPFSIIGGLRAAFQMLGYEVPMAIVMVCPAIAAGTLNISGIVARQATSGIWFILSQPIGFVILLICLLAEVKRIPFDIPEAETEIVAGWLTEFSGRKLALMRLSIDMELVFAAALTTALYLGGPAGPAPIPPIIYFLIKTTVVVLILSNLRTLFARFRIDQMVHGSWKFLTPLAILQVILVELTVG
jgi:NADH-quinone oxidoreductase subunit H